MYYTINTYWYMYCYFKIDSMVNLQHHTLFNKKKS